MIDRFLAGNPFRRVVEAAMCLPGRRGLVAQEAGSGLRRSGISGGGRLVGRRGFIGWGWLPRGVVGWGRVRGWGVLIS